MTCRCLPRPWVWHRIRRYFALIRVGATVTEYERAPQIIMKWQVTQVRGY